MDLLKQVIAIILVSFACGIGFNLISPHRIDILNNPWSKRPAREQFRQVENEVQLAEDDPVIVVGIDRTCQFVENREGMVLDARLPEAYAEGHIPGAYLLSFYRMSDYYPKLEAKLRDSQTLLVYCSDVNCEDSEFLANELVNLGYSPVLVYKGGFEEWVAHQLPVERGMTRGETP